MSGTGVWTVGTLNVNGTTELNITATVDASTRGTTITNYVSAIVADQNDSNASPDDLNESILVIDNTDSDGDGVFDFLGFR